MFVNVKVTGVLKHYFFNFVLHFLCFTFSKSSFAERLFTHCAFVWVSLDLCSASFQEIIILKVLFFFLSEPETSILAMIHLYLHLTRNIYSNMYTSEQNLTCVAFIITPTLLKKPLWLQRYPLFSLGMLFRAKT